MQRIFTFAIVAIIFYLVGAKFPALANKVGLA